jgi:hypothetical protein
VLAQLFTMGKQGWQQWRSPLVFRMDQTEASPPEDWLGPFNPLFTDEWLAQNGHSRQWLRQWFATPETDDFAMQEWVVHHKYDDPRLIVTPRKKF